jgi:sigma-E factor negative regulatory protein RseA
MNEELDSQLSAMFDDELPQSECELLARRLARDAALLARWGRYAAIGAAVRGADVRSGGRVGHRVHAALTAAAEAAQAPAAHAPSRRTSLLWWRPLAGAAVAAGVAALCILWLQGGFSSGAGELVARSAAPAAAALPTPVTYVVPRTVEPRMTVPPTELANYVVAHSEFSTPVSRRNLLSALMASEPVAAAAPEPAAGSVDKPNLHADDAH